jgi:CBS domain-containing protein
MEDTMHTKTKELMTPNPEIISPEATLAEAAQQMNETECGVLPVGIPNRLEGIITDRDIVIRAVSKGKNVNREKVKDFMTPVLHYCNEEDTVEDAAGMMQKHRIARLVVKDRAGNITGILTFGRILRQEDDIDEIAEVIQCATGKKAA